MEKSLANALDKAFSSIKLNPILLAKKTSVLFTDEMNLKLERWFNLHWAMSYREEDHLPDDG